VIDSPYGAALSEMGCYIQKQARTDIEADEGTPDHPRTGTGFAGDGLLALHWRISATKIVTRRPAIAGAKRAPNC
jgi:hypothetical protein